MRRIDVLGEGEARASHSAGDSAFEMFHAAMESEIEAGRQGEALVAELSGMGSTSSLT